MKKMEINNTIKKIVNVGTTNSFKKLLNGTRKYSSETQTHGWTGEITYPKNILV